MNNSRNIGILTEDEQDRIFNARVAVLGLGMGSVIAEVLIRLGFRSLLIIDKDTISDSNLNRQNYVESEVGKQKSLATKLRLLSINNNATIDTVDDFISSKNINLLSGCNAIVDTIDLSSLADIESVHVFARNNNIPIVFPINLGWRSVVTNFVRESPSLSELISILGGAVNESDPKDYEFWITFLSNFVPEYGMNRYEQYVTKLKSMSDWCPAPQIAPTIHVTASLAATNVVKNILGEKIVTAPEFEYLDLWEAIKWRHE